MFRHQKKVFVICVLFVRINEFLLTNKIFMLISTKNIIKNLYCLRSNSILFVKFPIPNDPAWELQSKPFYSEKTVFICRLYVGCNDYHDDYSLHGLSYSRCTGFLVGAPWHYAASCSGKQGTTPSRSGQRLQDLRT